MNLTDHRDIAADPSTVWQAILDPKVLKVCIPGCQTLTGCAEAGYEAVVKQKVGPVAATFTGIVKLSDITPGQTVTISGDGKGGAAGFAKGRAVVTLEAVRTGTRLSYTVEASVGGKLAQLGNRIIDGLAKKLADQFFEDFKNALEADESAGEVVAGDEPSTKKGWFRRMIG